MITIKDNSRILIIGCGRLGSNIANNLSTKNRNVTIIDSNNESFRKLSPSFSGLYIEGDATDISILKEAEIDVADIVIVVTDNDNINILIAQMSKNMFHVKNIIIRLYDAEKRCVYDECDIQTVLPSLLCMSEVDKIISGRE